MPNTGGIWIISKYTVKKYCKFYNKNAGSQSANQPL